MAFYSSRNIFHSNLISLGFCDDDDAGCVGHLVSSVSYVCLYMNYVQMPNLSVGGHFHDWYWGVCVVSHFTV